MAVSISPRLPRSRVTIRGFRRSASAVSQLAKLFAQNLANITQRKNWSKAQKSSEQRCIKYSGIYPEEFRADEMRRFREVDPNTHPELLEQYSGRRPLPAQHPNDAEKLAEYLRRGNVDEAHIQANVLDVAALPDAATAPQAQPSASAAPATGGEDDKEDEDDHEEAADGGKTAAGPSSELLHLCF